jgi:hypothetical protein
MPEYRNQKIVDAVDKIADELLKTKKSAMYRDHFFPEMINKMDYKLAAEIGVDGGAFSNHILSKTKLQKMFCVDPWFDDFGSGYQKEYFDPKGNTRMTVCAETLDEFIKNDRAEMVRATGLEASVEIPDGYLDFVYIDGDHSLEGIYNDIYAWTPKVRVGGIVAGHDYKDGPNSGMKDYWGNNLPYHIKTVVDYYGARYGYKINSVGGRIQSWWFVKA